MLEVVKQWQGIAGIDHLKVDSLQSMGKANKGCGLSIRVRVRLW